MPGLTREDLFWLLTESRDSIEAAEKIAYFDMANENKAYGKNKGGKVHFETFPLEHLKTHDPAQGGFSKSTDGRYTVSTGWKSRPRCN